MKKYLILALLIAFVFTSCSSDDDGNTNEPDPILGTWVLVEAPDAFMDPHACPDDSIVTFTDDNGVHGVFYQEDHDCQANESTGAWENLGDNQYRLDFPLGTLEGDVTFESANRFAFSSHGMQLVFEK